jgi:hypothetical protein
MTFRYELKLAERTAASRDHPLETFYWPPSGASSFMSPFGPRLGDIGPVNPLNADLVRLALLVFAADRSTLRRVGFTNWSSRDFAISVPVSDQHLWNGVSQDLAEMLGFLTGDSWEVRFRACRPRKELTRQLAGSSGPTRVVLMSGGADSALGVLESRLQLEPDQSHVLISHLGLSQLSPIQQGVAEAAAILAPGPSQLLHQIRLIRRQVQVEGTRFKSETSTRSRSLLFLALGLAHASLHSVPLWIPENGFASLNPPLGPNRRGSLSTKTTHPAFLEGLSDVLSRIGAQSEIINPFAGFTKGQMFRSAANRFGNDETSQFLSATHSCGLTGQRSKGVSPTLQCGVCFGCVVRRASFLAAGLIDKTEYADAAPSDELKDWLDNNSVLPDMRRLVKRGVTNRDLLALALPRSCPIKQARDLCDRGLNELRGIVE